jgi:hypothetical protein
MNAYQWEKEKERRNYQERKENNYWSLVTFKNKRREFVC